jgi:hypothetical protein
MKIIDETVAKLKAGYAATGLVLITLAAILVAGVVYLLLTRKQK